MKLKDTLDRTILRRSAWAGLMIVIVAALTLEARKKGK